MILEILPRSLEGNHNVKEILSDNKSVIYHKALDKDLIKKEIYLTSALIVFVLKGRQVIFDRNGKDIVLEKNSLSFFSKDVYWVSDYILNDESFEALLFFVDHSVIEKFVATSHDIESQKFLIPDAQCSPLYALQANSQIMNYVDSLMSVYSRENNTDALLEIKLLELLHLIAIQDKDKAFLDTLINYQKSNEKRRIREFMDAFYLKNLKIDDFALLTGRSTSTFIREFKRTYNTTPSQWLMEKRLDKAHDLLTRDGLSVTDAAFEVGYENVSHFIKLYKRKFSITPKKAKSISC